MRAGGFERKPQEVRACLSLIILVYGELAEQYGRTGSGGCVVALGKERAFDVRSAQSDVTYMRPTPRRR